MHIFTTTLKAEQDIVLARQKARQIAEFLGFETVEQTRIATAVSEISRNAFAYARDGVVNFELEDTSSPHKFVIKISDKGGGITRLKEILDGRYVSSTGMGIGIIGSRKIMDEVNIDSTTNGTNIIMARNVPRGKSTSISECKKFSETLMQASPSAHIYEVQQQNRELFAALQELDRRQEQLTKINKELEETNRRVVALYAELDKRAELLEEAVTEAKEAKRAADAANNAKTDFLANMSHEIRTPLNVVTGVATLLAHGNNLTLQQIKFVTTLQSSAHALLTLVNDLLDISKIEAGGIELERTIFNLGILIQNTLGLLSSRAQEKNLVIVTDVKDVLDIEFEGDSSRIAQIILNLGGNAIKFTPNGEVRVGVSIEPSNANGFTMVHIAVTDTGIGIAAEKQSMIFEKFSQGDTSISRKYGGTGLGLSISKRLAEAMDGDISIKSELGVGSTFTLSVPLRLAGTVGTAEKMNDEAFAEARDVSGVRLLLVEDHPPNVLVASSILEQLGYLVEVAMSGEDALKMIQANNYSAVIMDIQMAGMDGLEATRQIRKLEQDQHKPRLPIIGMTAHVLKGDQGRCIEAGMDGYVSKPFSIPNLSSALKKAVAV